jgi:hypothetical protein
MDAERNSKNSMPPPSRDHGFEPGFTPCAAVVGPAG